MAHNSFTFARPNVIGLKTVVKKVRYGRAVPKEKIFNKSKINKTMAKKLSITPVAGTKNRVIVKPAPAEEKTKGGIIIPDTAKEKPQRGTVMAVSPKDEDGNTPLVKEGNTVLYGKYAGT